MNPNTFAKLSGLMLCLSGAVYVADTILDALAPNISPGLGALVPIFGLAGFPGLWLSLNRQTPIAIAAYLTGMFGLAGLVAVTFLGNRVFPDLPPENVGSLVSTIGPEFLVIGVTFLLSAFLMLGILWGAGIPNRIGAVLYAVGAIPVSLPPLMPDWLLVVGGVTVGAGLLAWGGNLLRSAFVE